MRRHGAIRLYVVSFRHPGRVQGEHLHQQLRVHPGDHHGDVHAQLTAQILSNQISKVGQRICFAGSKEVAKDVTVCHRSMC